MWTFCQIYPLPHCMLHEPLLLRDVSVSTRHGYGFGPKKSGHVMRGGLPNLYSSSSLLMTLSDEAATAADVTCCRVLIDSRHALGFPISYCKGRFSIALGHLSGLGLNLRLWGVVWRPKQTTGPVAWFCSTSHTTWSKMLKVAHRVCYLSKIIHVDFRWGTRCYNLPTFIVSRPHEGLSTKIIKLNQTKAKVQGPHDRVQRRLHWYHL